MKVNTKLLVGALGILASIARNCTTNPAGIVNLFTDKGVLVLRTTNGTNYSSARVKVESGNLSLIGVNCGMLFHAIGTIAEELVDLAIVGNKLVVTAGLSVFRLPITVNELPTINKDFMVDSPFEFKTEEFIKGLSRVAHAAAVKDIRYYLNGVTLEMVDESINFVATDGHRLAKYSIPAKGLVDAAQFILPSEAIGFVMRNIASETFKLHLHASAFTFESPELVTQINAIEGRFPDYKKIIPKHKNSFTVDAKSLLMDLDRVKTVTEKNPAFINLAITDALVVSSGAKNEDEPLYLNHIPLISSRGGRFDTSFNADYLTQAIDDIEGNVLIKYGNADEDVSTSIVVLDDKDENFMEVIMPVRN